MIDTASHTTSTPLDANSAESKLTALIVDDDQFGREYLAVLVESLGFDVVQATDGIEGLELFHSRHPDIIVMDVLMPNMDGYETTRRIKATASDTHVPVIFLTGLNDTASLSQCLECGGDDFLTKPYNQIILTAKLNAHARARRFSLALRDRNEQLTYFKQQTERDQNVAERVFSKILARGQPSLPNIVAHVSPMAIFSGDVYQAAQALDGSQFCILGDFTGHGLSAAIGSLPVAEIFTNMVQMGCSLSTVAGEMNRRMLEILPPGMFFAAAMLRYDPASNVLSSWLGGLPSPFITDGNGIVVRTLAPQHVPLGVLTAEEFDDAVCDHPLPENGRVYLYTDGVIESESPTGTPFAEERLHAAVANTSAGGSAINSVLYALQSFTGKSDQQDDMSLIELRRLR